MKLSEVQMFAKAGRDPEVRLDTLLRLVPKDKTDRIVNDIKVSSMFASMGMDTIKAGESVLVLVAAYMGWMPVDVPEDAAQGGAS